VLEAAVLGQPRNRMAELTNAAAVEPESSHGIREEGTSLGDVGEPHSGRIDSDAKERDVTPMETDGPEKREGDALRRKNQHP
jgi:hypothetical protein